MLYLSDKGEYPRHIGDVQLAKKGFKQGDSLPKGWREVIETEHPVVTEDQVVFDSGPVEIDGLLYQGWEVRELTEEEKERKNAPATARLKLQNLGLTDFEIWALSSGLLR